VPPRSWFLVVSGFCEGVRGGGLDLTPRARGV
jgi:hypothetical protein